jgi:hypothetical protein
VFTAMTGIGLGIAATSRSNTVRIAAPLLGLAAAMGLHSLWNTSAGLAGGLGFLSVYAVVMVPAFLSLLAVVVAAMVRERSVIGQFLAPEVASGVLSPADLQVLSSLSGRRRALRAARRQGPAARRTRRELQHAAIELAFLRRHRARRPHHDEAGLAALEAAYSDELRQLAGSGAGSVVPAGAAIGASSSPASPALGTADPPPGWYPDPYGQARLRWWDGWRWTEHLAA